MDGVDVGLQLALLLIAGVVIFKHTISLSLFIAEFWI